MKLGAALREAMRLIAVQALAAPGVELLARHWALLLALGCALSVARDYGIPPADTVLFSLAGARLWSAGGLDTFANPIVQAGVGQLTLYRLTSSAEVLLRLPAFVLTSAAIQGGVVFGLVGLVARTFRRTGRAAPPVLLLGAGVVALLCNFGGELYLHGHPAQFAVPALWVLAGWSSRDGRGVLAGALVALSSTFEPWGVLGAPVLLLAADRRTLLRAAAATAGVLVLAWGPFLLFGEFGMHRYDWQLRPNSLLARLGATRSDFGWELRLLQGALALGAGAVTAWFLRASEHAVWAVLLAVVAARLLLDPIPADYYWMAGKVLVVLALATFAARRDARAVVLVPLLYPVFLAHLVLHHAAAVCCLLAVAVLVGMERRPQWLVGLKFSTQVPNVTVELSRAECRQA